jgi:hypothetical protein
LEEKHCIYISRRKPLAEQVPHQSQQDGKKMHSSPISLHFTQKAGHLAFFSHLMVDN